MIIGGGSLNYNDEYSLLQSYDETKVFDLKESIAKKPILVHTLPIFYASMQSNAPTLRETYMAPCVMMGIYFGY